MSDNNKHIKQYTAEDIQRYITRQMAAAERHTLEKAALEDPFLAEAIEGYMQRPSPTLSSDIETLKKRLNDRTENKVIKMRGGKIGWSAAAAIIIMLGAGLTWYWLSTPTENSLAQQKVKEQKIAPLEEKADSVEMSAIATDSVDIVLPENKTSEKAIAPSPKAEKKSFPPKKTKDLPAPKTATKKDKEINTSPDIAAADITSPVQLEEAAREKNSSTDNRKIAVSAARQTNASGFFNAQIITGRVTDSNNNALPFVNIRINNTSSSAYSDARGNFKLISGDTLLTVHIKSAGFQPRQVVLHASTPSNNIILLPEENALPEVVVTGYGTAKKKTIATDENSDKAAEAQPIDGWGNYDIYLANNIRLPGSGRTASRGFIELTFMVDKYGRLSDFNIIRSTCIQCNKEAIRVIKEGPQWKLSEGDQPVKASITVQF